MPKKLLAFIKFYCIIFFIIIKENIIYINRSLVCDMMQTNNIAEIPMNKNTMKIALCGVLGDEADRCQWQIQGDGGRESYKRTKGASARRRTRR